MKNKKKCMAAIGGIGLITAGNIAHQRHAEKSAEMTDGSGQTVLITGASGGIGRELATVFAEHNFDLVLAARNEEKLAESKRELEEKFSVHVMTIVKDLSDENSAAELYAEICKKGIFIDQLVNNAGAGKQAAVTDADPQIMQDLICLNIMSVTMLCRLFGHDMRERGFGRIMNVSSMGAFIPDPYFNVYGPTKAYELFLTEAMYGELHGTGVTVSALCPGPTKTNWAANAGKADARIAKDPRCVAQAGFIGMQAGQLIIIPDADYRVLRRVMQHLPAKMQARIIAGWQRSLIRPGSCAK